MIATVCLVLILSVTTLAWVVTRLFAFPPRRAIGCTPGDAGLTFEEVKFPSKDGLALSGWWIAQRGAKSVPPSAILVHPLGGNRCGYPGVRVKLYAAAE